MHDRPDFISQQDLLRWNQQFIQEKIASDILQQPILVELMYAGLWLVEQLQHHQCPDELIIRIQYTAGAASFGRDPWEIHQYYLNAYLDNDLVFAVDSVDLN
jgi:hypothetical protein